MTVGKMPLWLAWFIGWMTGLVLTLALVDIAGGTSFDQIALIVWLVVPAWLTPLVARRKGRRTLLWLGMAFALGVVGIAQPFLQPVMALIAVLVAGKPTVRVSDEELEAGESKQDLAALARLRAHDR
jgi:hypothetical protein